ncbi:MAG: hypothetical protein WCL04_02280 [Verrucomicrobiota bacterium]
MTTDSLAQPGFFARLFAPPTRLAALLPDGRFFLRIVEVESEGDAASVAEQVALALETLAPFPLAQLYHGHYWQPGSTRALVYAVYRKRFPAEETAAWSEAQIVLPAFTSLLIDPPAAGTTRVLTSPDAVTVFHWGDDALVPTHALIHPFPPEASESDRTAARDQLLRSLGTESTVEDWDYPVLRRVTDGGDVTFASGGRELLVPADLAAALDVRDNEEIAERRSIQRRDILLWRVALGMAALILLCVCAEGALGFGRSKVEKLKALIAANKPKQSELENIEHNTKDADTVLSRHLYPLEMLTLAVSGGRLPNTVTITNVQAQIDPKTLKSVLTLRATATTEQGGIPAAEAQNYVSALKSMPERPDVVFAALGTQGGGTGRSPNAGQPQTNSYQFQLTITFNNPVPAATETQVATTASSPTVGRQP